jgi:CRISPR/Cas system CSM-associated protein Csm3 (group 7 of RAMP superfamily)
MEQILSSQLYIDDFPEKSILHSKANLVLTLKKLKAITVGGEVTMGYGTVHLKLGTVNPDDCVSQCLYAQERARIIEELSGPSTRECKKWRNRDEDKFIYVSEAAVCCETLDRVMDCRVD